MNICINGLHFKDECLQSTEQEVKQIWHADEALNEYQIFWIFAQIRNSISCIVTTAGPRIHKWPSQYAKFSRTILATNYFQHTVVRMFRFHLINTYLKHSISITNMFVSHVTIEEHLLSGNMLI